MPCVSSPDEFGACLSTYLEDLGARVLQLHVADLESVKSENESLKRQLESNRKFPVDDLQSGKSQGTAVANVSDDAASPRAASDTQGSECIDEGQRSRLSSLERVGVSHRSAKQQKDRASLDKSSLEVNSVSSSSVMGLTTSGKLIFQMRQEWSKHRSADLQQWSLQVLHDESQHTLTQFMNPSTFTLRSTTTQRAQVLCLVHPNSLKRFIWVCLCLAFLCYDFFVLPLDAVFEADSAFIERSHFVARFFWTLDIGMSFRTGYYDDGRLVMHATKIAWKYASTWLLFDTVLVATEWATMLIESLDHASVVSFVRGLRWMRIARIVRLVRIARLAKFRLLLKELLVKTTASLLVTMRLSTMISIAFAFAHLGACMWGLVGKIDGGWIHANHMSNDAPLQKYAISLHWMVLALQGSRQAMITTHRTTEIFIDNSFLLLGLILQAWLFATVTQAAFAYADSDHLKLHKLARRFFHSRKISPDSQAMVWRFLHAHHFHGPGELLDYESKLFGALPLHLQEDLHYECRAPALCHINGFCILHDLIPRCVRQLCHGFNDKIAVEGHAVFSTGDACTQMYLLRSGCFEYRCTEKILASTPRLFEFPRESLLPGTDLLRKGHFLSEACFWTDWEHVGELIAKDQNALFSELDVDVFVHLVSQYRVGRIFAVKYAYHYVRLMNRSSCCDIMGFDCDLSDLDNVVFDGTGEDHFIFISHYKVESGTEATMLRDWLFSRIREDELHEATDMQSPVFVDSEDLQDLGRLQAHIVGTANMIILLTPGVFSRPWCLLEIVTAVQHGIQLIPIEVHRPGMDFAYPDDAWYAAFRQGNVVSRGDVAMLRQMGVSLEEAEDAVRQVFRIIALPFSPHKSGNVRAAELEDILKRCSPDRNFAPSTSVTSRRLASVQLSDQFASCVLGSDPRESHQLSIGSASSNRMPL